MARPADDLSRLLGAAAAGLERGELVTAKDEEPIVSVERLGAWLESDPEITAQALSQLEQLSGVWKEQTSHRLELLGDQAHTVAKIISATAAADPAGRAAILTTQRAVLESIASTARLSVAIITTTAAIDRRTSGGEGE